MNLPATTAVGRRTGHLFSDANVIGKRNLLRILRTPQLIIFNAVQPIMFTLLFRYVFGGSIPLPGWKYADYLIPGIIVQTTLFSGAGTAIAMAEDSKAGIIDRFRSLPMAARLPMSLAWCSSCCCSLWSAWPSASDSTTDFCQQSKPSHCVCCSASRSCGSLRSWA
jgi:ABC-type multidrug transport system permease subunit